MGLDMYAYAIPADAAGDRQTDIAFREGREQLHYWRKHHDLHGWMERLYRKKGGESKSFNCNTVRLTSEDLDHLEKDVNEGKLPATTGFFFGNYPPNPDSVADDLAFIEKARAAIAVGKVVLYDSWW